MFLLGFLDIRLCLGYAEFGEFGLVGRPLADQIFRL